MCRKRKRGLGMPARERGERVQASEFISGRSAGVIAPKCDMNLYS